MSRDTAQAQFAAIDLVRFGCALLVVAHHYATMIPIAPPRFLAARVAAHPLSGAASGWSWSGWIGVEIFFLVSGFVIAISAERGGGPAFLRRRVLRLAPGAFACASLSALVLLASGAMPAAEVGVRWLASVSFWPLAAQIDSSYWTLGLEVAFYLLVATQLNGGNNRPAIERLALLLAAISGGWWLAVGIGLVDGESNRGIDLLLLPHGCFFASGIALWCVRADGWRPMRAATLAMGLAAGTAEIVHQAHFMAEGLGLAAGPALPLAQFALALAILAAAGPLQAPLLRLVGGGPLARAGRATYPLYLLHYHIGGVLIVALVGAGWPQGLASLAALLLVLALAGLVAGKLELALRRRLDGWLSRPRGLAPDSLPTASLPTG